MDYDIGDLVRDGAIITDSNRDADEVYKQYRKGEKEQDDLLDPENPVPEW